MVILIVCYLRVFKALKIHERTVAKNLRNGNARKVSLSLEDIKVTKILFVTVVAFIFCWTPILVLDVVDNFLGSGWELNRETYYMYSIFGISSSAINPYHLWRHEFFLSESLLKVARNSSCGTRRRGSASECTR